MKKISLKCALLCSLFLFSLSDLQANVWEFSIKLTSNGTTLIGGRDIYLYKYNDVQEGFMTPYRQCVSTLTDPGFRCDIDDSNTDTPSWSPITTETYLLRIDNDYIGLTISADQDGGDTDFKLDYNASATNKFTFEYNNRGSNTHFNGSTSTWSYSPISVVTEQKLSNNQIVGKIKRWTYNPSIEPYNDWVELAELNKFLTESAQVLLADQALHDGEKFFRWEGENSISLPVENPQSVTISPSTQSIISRFKQVYNATINAQLIETGGTDSVSFKDPWLNDASGNYGVRNQGMSAPFKPIVNGANNIGISSQNKGVFLGQDPSFANSYYSVSANATKTVGGIPWYFINWTGTYTNFQSATATTTPIYFSSADATITANYKGSLSSTTSTAMSLPSQRKIFCGSNGVFYLAYESQGKIWVEYSTNATSWQLANNSQPIGSGITPSVTSASNGIYLIFNNQHGFSQYLVTQNEATLMGAITNDSYGSVLSPVISVSSYGDFIVLWNNGGGIRYNIGTYSSDGNGHYSMLWSVANATLSGTNSSSYTASVECNSNVFQVAWQQGSGSSSTINYKQLTRQSDGTFTEGSTTVMSSGYPQNYSPSLIAVSGGARVCWIGNDPYDNSPVAIFHDPAYSTYWYFGSGVTSANINQSSSNYVIGWVNGDGSHQYTNSGHLGNPQSLTSNGQSLQIVNNSSSSSMRSLGFNTSSSPYRFNLSSTIPLYKSSADPIGTGRGGLVNVDGAQFIYLLGDITVDNQKIEFIEMSDRIRINDVVSLNNFLETKPFMLTSSKSFNYTMKYWTSDSAKAASVLKGGRSISFKIELVDVQTGSIISEIDQCTNNSLQVIGHKTMQYDVNTSTIGTRSVKLRLRVILSSDASFAVVNAFAKGTALKKSGSLKSTIDLEDVSFASSYSLAANYPNPFNPNTQISYKLKEAGFVTLGIYDMLGREISLLVNEYQESGAYNATWNAESHSSGTYVYCLSVKDVDGKNQFTETKRMTLLK